MAAACWDKWITRRQGSGGGIPVRYTVAAAAFINFIYVYMLRLNINIVIVAMINYTAIPHANATAVTVEECGHLSVSDNDQPPSDDDNLPDGEFVWDEQLQSLVSGSFFWGYIVTQLFGGRLAERIGSKYLIAATQTAVGVVTLLLPALAHLGVEFFIMGRVMLGLAQGVIIPSVQPLVSRWAPETERNSMSTFIFSGSQVGTILGLLFSGMMADSLGWRAVFYIEGSLAFVAVVPWLFAVYDYPSIHPRISEEEKDYIKSSTTAASGMNKTKTRSVVPWRSIVTSVPCWALLAATLGNNWAFYMLLVQLPIYMRTILRFDLKSNALLSALPWLVMWVFSLLVARLSDVIAKKGWATKNVIRKTANTVAHCGNASCLIAVSFVGCDRWWTLALLTLSIGLMGAVYSGFLINHLDLAPNLAGTVYGLISGIASINSWLAPLVVATITEGQQTLARWRIAFLLSAAILVLDAVIFIAFGSTERQQWDNKDPPAASSDLGAVTDDDEQQLETLNDNTK